jgi:adenine-specific DNA-methyltransferase
VETNSTIEQEEQEGSLVLDFFAGSGTTGDAVMQLNREGIAESLKKHQSKIEALQELVSQNGGKVDFLKSRGQRRYILVQLDEPINEKSLSSHQFCKENNLEPVISSLTQERLRRAGEKIAKEPGGQFVDTGFKAFRLVDKANRAEQTALDRVYNMSSSVGIELSEKVEAIIKDCLYKVKENYFLLADCDLSGIDKTKRVYIDGYAKIDFNLFTKLALLCGADNIAVIY